jgi:glycine hydroxymethyltransferase
METIAIERAKKIFHADHANVQALSGAAANVCIYNALLEPGDTILGMDLSHGGHLTHGSPVTLMSKVYNFVRYKTSAANNNFMDYDNLREMALEHKPKLIIAGYSAHPRELDYEKFVAIGKEVGAIMMADVSHFGGLIAAGVMKNPSRLWISCHDDDDTQDTPWTSWCSHPQQRNRQILSRLLKKLLKIYQPLSTDQSSLVSRVDHI